MPKVRGEQRFGAITYSCIAGWTGLKLGTIQSYGARGVFDPRDLEATLQWVNRRPAAKRLPPIGQANEEIPKKSELDTLENVTNNVTPIAASGYNSRTGEFT